MEVSTAYLPQAIFAPSDRGNVPPPRVFISPQRYIQGRDVLRGVGRYLSLMRAKRVALLMSEGRNRNEGVQLLDGLRSAGIESVVGIFRGECSIEEITAHAEALSKERIDCVIAAGGGKCIDTGKGVAFRLGTPVVIVPTLASNDAPCSALSVLYSPEGFAPEQSSIPTVRPSSLSTRASSRQRRNATSLPAWATPWPPGTRRACAF